jgi:hypothetical protein
VTEDEARAVARILAGADGACYICAARAACEAKRAFPGFAWFELVAAVGGWSADKLRSAACDEDDDHPTLGERIWGHP